MKENNMTDYHELESYYASRLVKIVADLGYKYIAWQDPIENGVNVSCKFWIVNNVIIHM